MKAACIAIAIAAGMCPAAGAQAQTARAADPIDVNEVPRRKTSGSRPCRRAAPTSRSRRRGAIQPSPAPTTTATRQGSRSSGRRNSRDARSTASRRRSSRRSRSSARSRPSSAIRRSANFPAPRARCTGSRTTSPPTAAPGSSPIRWYGKVPPLTEEVQQRGVRASGGTQGTRPGRLVFGSQPLRPLHHPRRPRLDDAGDLRQLVPDRAEPGRRDHHLRDDPRHSSDSASTGGRMSARRSGNTSATPAATGKATRSSSRRRTSPTRRRTADRAST